MRNEATFKKIKKYAALSGTAIAAMSSARADIVYTDMNPDSTVVDATALTEIDIDGDGTMDIMFDVASVTTNTTGGGTFTWSYGVAVGFASAIPFGNATNGVVGATAGFPYASAFSSQSVIGSSNGFVQVGFLPSYYFTQTFAPVQWNNQTEKFLGIKFDISGALHYGWIRLNTTVKPASMTILDYAYESIADSSIMTGVNWPAAIAEEITLQADVMVNNNVLNVNFDEQVNGAVQVTDASGRVINREKINTRNYTFSMQNLAKGVYVVNVESPQGMLRERVVL